MAFLQPQQRPQAQRHAAFSLADQAPEPARQIAVPRRPIEESQEWILFSPTVDEQQSTTSRTSQTPRTAAFSRISDFDSIETGLRSDQDAGGENNGSPTCQGTELDDDEAGELDSLDDGLHAFHAPLSPRLDTSGGTVLPTHDGLGTFPSTYPTNEGMQEHLWQFERYNPHRRRPQRRRSSVQKRLNLMMEEEEEEMRGLDKHEERRLRIEKWRLEQSRAVLEEIERETRRRRRRMSLVSGQSNAVTQSEVSLHDTPTSSSIMHDTTTSAPVSIQDNAEAETFWQRITRRVIKDLMGLDETTLSVIFGEELPPDNTPTQSCPLTTTTSTSILVPHSDLSWEQRLLERIARELGLLADRISEHEGAFSTYNDAPRSLQHRPVQEQPAVHPQSFRTSPADEIPTDDNLFAPTFPKTTTAPEETLTSLWGIEEEAPLDKHAHPTTATDATQQDNDYWERDLDVGVIFRYLRNRFSRSHSTPTAPSTDRASPREATIPNISTGPLPPAWASSDNNNVSALGTSPESLRRADMIRRHHPLVSHAANMSATRRRESMLLRRQHQFLLHKRAAGSSSCASQSTKRTRSGSSRRYWDFPSGAAGSGAGGSLVSVSSGGYGMMGSWGEV